MTRLQDEEILNAFLHDLAQADMLHEGLLNTLLKKLFPHFGRKASVQNKAWLYRCARKISTDARALNWRDGLLVELQTMPEFQHEFLLGRLKTFYPERNPEHERIITSLNDTDLMLDVKVA